MIIGILKRSLVLFLLLAEIASACDDNDADGLDVALVLSGGGALATTHVGAIDVIEQLGVPVHCVVGTSMGSVVGALYAAGYDAAALKDVFQDSRWPEVFNNVVSRREKSYLLKEQDDLDLSGYLAGIDRAGLRLPGGFRSMGGLRRLFRGLLRNQPVAASFDDLPRRFRAVAMDLSTGAPIALSEGDLVESMLASMAVPGVFAPREIDGRVLVDGGLAAQLPIDVAQAMGADLIIALDTTVEPPVAEKDWSVAQVSQQLIRLTVWQNWQAQRARLGPNDVLIQPDIGGLSTSSFERAKLGFANGSEAARDYEAALLKIRALAAPAQSAPRQAPSRPTLETLVVANTTVLDDELLKKRLGFQPADFEDSKRLQQKLRDLAAFGPFGETDLAVSEDGQAMLQVEPFPLGRNLLSGGFRAANNFRGNSRYALLGQLSRRPFAARGGDLRLSAELGTDLGLGVELYLPFGSESRFFSVSSLGYRAEQLLLDQNNERIGEYWQQRGEGRLRLGRELNDWGVIAVDGIIEAVRTETLISVVDIPAVATDLFLGGGVLFAIDTLDRANWPEQGLQMIARAERLEGFDGGNVNGRADSYSVSMLKPLSVGPLDMLLRLDAAATENKSGTVVNIQRLGGFRRLSARAENSLLNDRYVLGSLEVFKRLNPSESVFSIPLYVGALFEVADAQLELFEPQYEDQFYSLATYVGTDTALGPFFLGTGFDFDGNFSLFMHFGRTF